MEIPQIINKIDLKALEHIHSWVQNLCDGAVGGRREGGGKSNVEISPLRLEIGLAPFQMFAKCPQHEWESQRIT